MAKRVTGRASAAALLLLVPLSQPAAAAAAAGASAQLAALVAEFWQDDLRMRPFNATSLGDPRYNGSFPNFIGPQYLGELKAQDERYLARAKQIDPKQLTAEERLTWEVFVRARAVALAGFQFPNELLPVNQFQGQPQELALFGSGRGPQPFRSVKDYDDWVQRARGFPVWADQAIVNMRTGVQRGIVLPRPLVERAIPQLESLAKGPPEASVFWGPLRQWPDAVPVADRERLTGALRSAIERDLLPSYQRLLTYVRDEYLPHARETVAFTALPNGKAWYAWQIERQTTTRLSADEIHAIGLHEVERIGAEMDRLIADSGYRPPPGTGTEPAAVRRAYIESLRVDPRFYFTNADDLLAGFRALKGDITANLPRQFDIFPRADFEIRPVEAFRAASAAGGSYQRASPDGTRPGIFYVNTYDLKSQPKFMMEALFLHEALPGHHFQIAIQQEQTQLPEFRRYGNYTAYAEGWGLYAETLGSELGQYKDPYSRFGGLSSEMFRAVRLVVDTGMHAKGWTRERALEYMLANTTEGETAARAEIDRYLAVPAQALCYKLGQLKIQELQNRARARLGDRFDVRAFHRQILIDGPLPLEVLDSKIERWIAAQSAAR
jgi:uncharacterized protein (DUF885 family)